MTQRARAGVSFAFQQPVRFKGFTVRRLLELSAGQKLSTDKLCEMLSRVGLCGREYIDREVDATLSGGEIKRIEIATVLARHTKLSLFDEPEAGIDLWSFTNLIDVFQSMRGKSPRDVDHHFPPGENPGNCGRAGSHFRGKLCSRWDLPKRSCLV